MWRESSSVKAVNLVKKTVTGNKFFLRDCFFFIGAPCRVRDSVKTHIFATSSKNFPHGFSGYIVKHTWSQAQLITSCFQTYYNTDRMNVQKINLNYYIKHQHSLVEPAE